MEGEKISEEVVKNNNSQEKKTCGDEESEVTNKLSDAVASLKIPSEAASQNINNNIPQDTDSSDEIHIETVTTGNTPYNSAKTFEELNLSNELLKGLYAEMRFEKPSKIQAVTLPMILTPPHQHLIAQAHNGSGKTTCFVLGMLSRVDPNVNAPQALCVCPTRELALQNQEVLRKIGKYTKITSACAVKTETKSSGGTYIAMSRRDPITDQIVIGTPGTIRSWITKGILSCRYIKVLVFDEADHMLAQDGFQDDSLRILKAISGKQSGYQILFFSATYNDMVKQFAQRIIPKANEVFVRKEELSLDVIKQYCVRCPDELAKIEVLKDKIFPLAEKLGQTIIFVRTRESARRLHEKLDKDGYKCTSIHGELSLEDRDRVINEFKRGVTRILISTDVLARGFDQAQVTLVVNYDLPVKYSSPSDPDYEVYLHRIGRSGRFGRKGAAFNLLCTERDDATMRKIQEYFQRDIEEIAWNNEDALEKALEEAGLA